MAPCHSCTQEYFLPWPAPNYLAGTSQTRTILVLGDARNILAALRHMSASFLWEGGRTSAWCSNDSATRSPARINRGSCTFVIRWPLRAKSSLEAQFPLGQMTEIAGADGHDMDEAPRRKRPPCSPLFS